MCAILHKKFFPQSVLWQSGTFQGFSFLKLFLGQNDLHSFMKVMKVLL